MKNFENIKIPKQPIIPFHTIKEQTLFVEGENYPLSNVVLSNKKLGIAEPVIVLEESVGYEAEWAKVIIRDSSGIFNIIGFVHKKVLQPTKDAKPFLRANVEKQNLPNEQSAEIDWRLQPSNKIFSDDKRGLFCVTYDTGLEKVEDNLEKITSDALYASIQLILKEKGKKSTPEYAYEIQNKYYLFGMAEAIDVSFRYCSTLRVLVSIPKKYVESNEITKSSSETVSDPSKESEVQTSFTNTTVSGDSGPENQKPPKKTYVDIIFNSYKEYDNFFNDISYIGVGGYPSGVLNKKDIVFKARQWTIEPNGVYINFANDAAEIQEFRNLIEFLILENIPDSRVNDVYSNETLHKIKTAITALNNQLENFINISWEGKLTLKINVDDLKLSYIRFDTVKKEQIPLNIGVLKFLENSTIKSKKNVNYILQRHLSIVKHEYYREFRRQKAKFEIDKAVADPALAESLLTAIKIAINVFRIALFVAAPGEIIISEIISRLAGFSIIEKLSKLNEQQVLSIAVEDLPTIVEEIDYIFSLHSINIGEKIAKIISVDQFKKIDTIFDLISNTKTDEEKKLISNRAKEELNKKYPNVFLIEKFSSAVEEINVENPIADEFISGEEDTTRLLEDLDYEKEMSDFITKYYYAINAKDGKVTKVEVRPLDITQCVKNSFNLYENSLKKGKEFNDQAARLQVKYLNAKKSDRDKQVEREGNDLLKAVLDKKKITNKAVRRVLQIDKPSKELNALETFNFYVVPAIKELNLNAILIETLKCSSVSMSPAEFRNMLNQYNNAKKIIEDAAFATVCNPYLTAGIKKFNTFRIPQLPTINKNKNLSDELTNLAINIIQQIMIISVRLFFTRSIDKCVGDKNKEKNPGSANSPTNLADAFDSSPNDDQAVNDTIDDIFGLNSKDFDGNNADKLNALEEARSKAKEKLKNLLDNLMCVLTTKEICDLVRGKTVDADAYEVIRSIIRNKNPDLADNFSTNEEIASLFIKLGNSVTLQICDDITANPNNLLPANPLCDDGTLENARRKLLEDKNLPQDVIDAIIDDVKAKEAKNVEDILKFLDSDSPFDASNIPSVLCQKGPNGETIPPVINVGVPVDSFKSMLDMLLKNTYTTFNEEALEWSKITYSVSSSSPQTLIFNQQTGKIEAVQPKKETSSEQPRSDISKEIFPAYLFNQIITDSTGYNLGSSTASVFEYLANINGNKQQQLDANIINDSLRTQIETANQNLKIFLGEITEIIEVYVNKELQGYALDGFEKGFKEALLERFGEIVQFLGLIDNFRRMTPSDLEKNRSEIFKKILSVTDSSDERALFLENSGASLYLTICGILKKKRDKMLDLFKFIGESIGEGDQAIADPQSLSSFTDTNQTFEQYFESKLTKILAEYDGISKFYEIVFRASFQYPNYSINFSDNLTGAGIPDNFDIHSLFKLEINRNNENYLNIEDSEDVDKELTEYIRVNLGLSGSYNPSKKDVFNSFVRLYNNDSFINYEWQSKEIFKKCVSNIKTSPFLKVATVQAEREEPMTGSSGAVENQRTPKVQKVYSDYMKLVTQQTDLQKNCNIFPHYLDIDSIKEKAIESKKQSYCIDQIINQKIINNEPINSKELETLETNETQNIILRALYLTAIRVYVHDIILRGIGPFGYYDPQILREDNLFVDYIAAQAESEMKSLDNTFFNMMLTFLAKQYKIANPEEKADIKFLSVKRQIFKKTIRNELRKSILPKMSKRIMEDTNEELKKNLSVDDTTRFNLRFIGTAKELNEQFDGFLEQNGEYVVLNVKNPIFNLALVSFDPFTGKAKNIKNSKLENIKVRVYKGNLESFNDSKPEFRLLFNYLFPLKKYITVLFITNAFCTSTRRQILDTFKGTKKGLISVAKIVQTNGQPITPNLNNPQDVANSNTDDDLLWFILKALLTTPAKIAKGFIEATDPNVAIVSTTYKIAKQFEPDIPSYTIPAVGLPMGLLGLIPFSPLLPVALNPLNGAYYGLGLWYEDSNSNEKNKSDAKKRKYLNDLLDSAASGKEQACGEDNKEIIKQDEQDFYKPVKKEEP